MFGNIIIAFLQPLISSLTNVRAVLVLLAVGILAALGFHFYGSQLPPQYIPVILAVLPALLAALWTRLMSLNASYSEYKGFIDELIALISQTPKSATNAELNERNAKIVRLVSDFRDRKAA